MPYILYKIKHFYFITGLKKVGVWLKKKQKKKTYLMVKCIPNVMLIQ